MRSLSNQYLTIRVADHGAELSGIVANATGKEYLWQADPAFWKRHSPVLFPIVGSVWEGKYRQDGATYSLSQHGFARDRDFTLVHESENELRFALESDERTREVYPFDFRLEIGYRLEGNRIEVIWRVVNTGDRTAYFQIGAHPAFYYPNYDLATEERGYFAFDVKSGLVYRALAEKGCVGDEIRPVPLDTEGLLPLNVHTFDIDTFILENSQVRRVDLLDVEKRPYLSLSFTAPLVGLWSPPTKNAPFVCIEPWYGRCDRVNYSGEYKDRDWVNRLEPGEVFDASYTIEIHL